jgi:hypothetical protein
VTQEIPPPRAPGIDRPDPRAPVESAPATSIDPTIRIDPRDRGTPSPSASPFRRGREGDFPSGRDDSAYDPTKPQLDVDAMRKRAAQLGVGNRAVLPFPMPADPERKTKEQIAIEKARKPDCRNAYAGLGLLAVVPLIANEFGEGNCRW